MPHLTTHVLDAASGSPAPGIPLTLTAPDGSVLARAETDADGRAGLGPDVLAPGDYTLRFDTRGYFDARGTAAFYPFVSVTFTVADERHYHVPILLSPFAYSTYRGS
ncbi:hydroxyisourate hydrolase [Microbacterium sp. ZXX196]|uniref:hydroxyisourate hydrolase n=1 Tax=Microbacterium sp. ZXX196 TaxID=2609291 RepID=UPI0012B918CC|nr:hydroxyisourate hydrolase [Microbacterium sp. ZXX196]MTE23889.1 hydroxyisourate hydrolase [Microbacterium sp. ZXX196]